MANEKYEKERQRQMQIAAERRAHVRKLREAGLTFEQIGGILGVSRARVHKMYWYEEK